MVTDHKNLEYFKMARILNRQQARWALEIQDIPYRIKYRKGIENTVADALLRRKDHTEPLPKRTILNEGISWEKAKTQGYHLRIDVDFLEKGKGRRWKYKGREILENQEEREAAIKRLHNHPETGHTGKRDTLRRVTELWYWDSVQKDVEMYI